MNTRLETLPHRHVLTMPAVGSAVRTARETTEQVLVEWGISRRHPTVDPALLILGELVTNSVRHAAVLSPNVTVIYASGPDTFAFAVHDRHPYLPSLYASSTAQGGGGLATVVELTLGLGGTAVVRADADYLGKSIWITLPL
ncbi:ATP-binding protein [Streptomyces lunaelactis]|uniref:ATP-binding protein n=1 Tax=Streptomyces lunaelactis TaxID=1535768 RepID=UPI0015858248|nr:ATP-binding protein [Streptomyces lunaelactis]NUK05255.1 ATP-binding protein [Streptomyces lunaelactis]NUK19327.1 ATP-binding protein [Streptomyces lunaelactis]NUK26221.1 ATP-binding protein [Streptomyces lunaelactis]NUK34884.1 ATP-binding protein [Streptomyces lunaelactis]NUK45169.1 ATP-binding protein [Streptomyces lunaelactis]